MERLTFGDDEMMCNCPVKTTGDEDDVTKFCDQVCDEWQSNCPYMKMGKKLKHYEDLEDQGRLIELPCKAGDKVYIIGKLYNACEKTSRCEDYDSEEYLITWCEKYCPNGYKGIGVFEKKVNYMKLYSNRALYIGTDCGMFDISEIGKSVFLTKSEAERILAERQSDEV